MVDPALDEDVLRRHAALGQEAAHGLQPGGREVALVAPAAFEVPGPDRYHQRDVDVETERIDHQLGQPLASGWRQPVALEQPLRQIVLNAAQEPATVLERVEAATQPSFGYNAARREYGDLIETGVIDPAKVTRLALQNAGSIASLILTIDCLVAEAPRKSPSPGGPAGDTA